MTTALFELIAEGVAEGERSQQFFAAVAQLKRLGWSSDGIVWLLAQHPDGIASKYAQRLPQEVERDFRKITINGARLGDFFSYMPLHQYYFAPARRLWPAASLNSRFPHVALLDDEGNLVMNSKIPPKPVLIPAASWLDRNRPVEETTWAPGEPMLVHDHLMVGEVGWVSKPEMTTFNLYHPPIIQAGEARQALPWVRLVYKLFGHHAKHLIISTAQLVAARRRIDRKPEPRPGPFRFESAELQNNFRARPSLK
jgi:hypothetical protein